MRTALGAIGRAFVAAGALILLFVAYQLWGTGIYEARQQDHLKTQFRNEIASRQPASTTTSTTVGRTTTGGATTTATTATTSAPSEPPAAADGDPVGIVTIPKLGLEKVVVEGTSVPDLRKGPGHYTGSPIPGQRGNAAIAGHRTTYGAPFGDLDQLARGDSIVVQTLTGKYAYVVTEDPFAVSPNETDVLKPKLDDTTKELLPTLTLTTCNPKYSATERLIVKAELAKDNKQPPLPAPMGATRVKLSAGLSGTHESRLPTLLWGVIAAAVGGLWWLVFHRYARWTTWLAGVVPFLASLFVFYTYLERVLPSNY
jgi:sortase A